MTQKTIKISERNYRWLAQFAGGLQRAHGRPVSLDDALTLVRRKRISDLAGSWKMSDKEAADIRKSLAEGWKKWKISV